MTGNTTGPHLHFQTGAGGKWSSPGGFIPGLKVGGNVISPGIAELHKKETVLTEPLSADLKNGIRNLDQGAGTTYNVTMDLRGAYIKEDVDIESALDKALAKKEGRLGRKRKVT
jgi:murein DD-endopeptidase MepM/ murein hydrolase activator NlpD